ncbi:MAG: alpha/beta hydrolase [bacterium]|nr:alpha/beta hydrolase [bacterium]
MKNSPTEPQILTQPSFFYDTLGDPAKTEVIWAHGWGQTHAAMKPLAESLKTLGYHYVLDLPGFGASPRPEEIWDTQDYADHIASWLKTLPPPKKGIKRIWVGHSFGCRVGIRLAATYPDLIDGLFLMGAAGLKKRRTFWETIAFKAKIYSYKVCKNLIVPLGVSTDWLRKRFGSADYQSAGNMRDILVKTVSEDLTEVAKQVTCPVHLVFGEKDDQTPPEMGERFQRLMPNAQLSILPGQDHYSILGSGRHQVLTLLKTFIGDAPRHD